VHALEGDLDRARAEFAEFRHLPDTFPVGIRWMGTLRQIGLAAILLADAEVADAVRRRFAPFAHYYSADGSGAVFHGGSVAGLVGDLARVAGRPEEARGHYRAAVERNVRIGARPFTATARLGWARTLVAEGVDLLLATDLVGEAAAEFERMDMPGPLRTARALRSELATRRLPSLLSAREHEVADLVATALPNREIARRLFLSERTVESHVRNILTKLGFTRRTQIVAWVVQGRPSVPTDHQAPV
jgi:DNA-binding CsgD family transcriptional regulator